MKKMSKRVIYSIVFMSVFVFGLLSNLSNSNNYHGSSSFESDFKQPKTSSSPVNGRSLFVNQYANITESFTNLNSGDNVTFTLYDDWVSQNTTIYYDGVTQKRGIISNGAFDDDDSGWTYKTNCDLSGIYQSNKGHPVDDGCISLDGAKNARLKGDYAYFEQNITLDEELGDDDASFSCYYNSEWSFDQNASVFMSVIIGNVEINKSINIFNVPTDTWFPLSFDYNPVALGQVLQGLVTIRVGLILDGDSSSDFLRVHFDNFKYEVYTKANELGIVKAFDNQFSQNYTYYNTSYGEGYSFIDTERTPDSDNKVDFTIYSNRSGLLGFFIEEITIISHAIMAFNSTVSNTLGSLYTMGENISWQVEFTVDIPVHYNCWLQVDKPIDWSFYEIYYETIDKTGVCQGTEYGSNNLSIPYSVLEEGDWRLNAVSSNYMNNFTLEFWNQSTFDETSQLSFGNLFRFNATLNNSISLTNTQINCSIFYPNASLFWHLSREPTSYDEAFGNFTVGKNMTVGKYTAEITWVNNQSYLERDKVGFLKLEFNLWHHTNLTAVDSYSELIAGDPLLLKVNYVDFNLNASIHFASITYNSTFGTSGTMVYLGSGIYFIDIDTNTLSLGDYYFSFNASKAFYENQTMINLIHLKIVVQPLALEVPHYTLEGNANSIISCNINTTGAISGTKVYPANVSTNWFNPYNVTDHNNGTYMLDFSTTDIPTSGFLESFTIEIFANKTNYGSTSEFITLIVHPLATEAHVNTSLVSVNSNNVINLKVNYTEEVTSEIITDSNCSLTWESSYMITPVADGFNIQLHTTGLAVDYYTALIKLEKVGYEVAFESVTVIIIERDVYYQILIDSIDCSFNKSYSAKINQNINFSIGVYSAAEDLPVPGGTVYISDGENIYDDFTIVNNHYQMEMNTSQFGLGVHFLSIVFNETDYQSASETIQLSISKLRLNASLFNTNQTLVKDRNENFDVVMYVEDSLSGLPVLDANISYSWIFGRGVLTNIGGGQYKFEDISPRAVGPYEILFTITSPNFDYEPQTLSITLVSQVPEGSIKLWWILVPLGAVAIISITILSFVIYKQKVVIPKQQRAVELLRKKTQIFDDITLIKSILIIETGTGRLMYQQQFGGLKEDHEDIFSGFLHSILTLSNKFALKNGDLGEKQEYAEFSHESFNVLVASGEKIIVALILEDSSSPGLQGRAFKFIDEFEGIYKTILVKWNGDRSIFNDTTPKLFEEIFHLSLLNRFTLTKASNIALIEKSLIHPGTLMEKLSQIIKTVSAERHDFLLTTLISLIPEEEQLEAKDVILRFIKNKYLVPAT